MSLVRLGSCMLWRLRHRPLAVVGIFLVFFGYYLLLLFHLKQVGLVLRHVVPFHHDVSG